MPHHVCGKRPTESKLLSVLDFDGHDVVDGPRGEQEDEEEGDEHRPTLVNTLSLQHVLTDPSGVDLEQCVWKWKWNTVA